MNADKEDDTGSIDTAAPKSSCGPQVQMAHSFPVEGDLVVLELICSEDVDRSGFSVSVHTEVDDAVMDPESWQLTWQTGLSDAGGADFLFSVTDPGSGMPETVTFTAWITDNWSRPDNHPVDPQTYLWEFGLPVIHLTTPTTMTQEYQAAQVDFQGSHYSLEAKLRGAASLSYPKNSYTLKFSGEHLDAADFGLPDKDHLILISTFDDNSYIRQKLVYDLWIAMADFWGEERLVIQTFFTVLYLDGEYHGLYVASDHVDNQLMEQRGLNRDANLYKSVNHDANFYSTNYYGNTKSTLHDGYEKKEGEPESGQGAYADLDELVRFAYESSDADFVAKAGTWFDLPEFMDWFLLVYFTHSQDSGGKNVYLYNDPGDPGFRYAPWDFNASFGQNWMTLRIGAGEFDDFTWANNLFRRFQLLDALSPLLWDRLSQLMQPGMPFSDEWLQTQVSSYYEAIHFSAQRDWSHWGGHYRDYGGWEWWRDEAGDWTTYEEEAAYVTAWLTERVAWAKTLHP